MPDLASATAPKIQSVGNATELCLAFSDGPFSNTELKPETLTWEAFVNLLERPTEGPKDGSYLVRGGDLVEPRRGDKNLRSADVFVIDGEAGFDGETGETLTGVDPDTGETKNSAPPIEVARDALARLGYQFVIHQTHSAVPGKIDRWRAYVPARMRNAAELEAVAEYVTAQLQAENCFVDCVKEMKTFSQAWALPRCRPKYLAAYKCYSTSPGRAVDVAAAVAFAKAQKEATTARERYEAAPQPERSASGPSPIESFNATATLDGVRKMLQDAGYRFAYRRGEELRLIAPGSETKTAGVHVFKGRQRGDIVVYSHHGGHDPLSGRLNDAFGVLTRVTHKGNQDAAIAEAKVAVNWKGREPGLDGFGVEDNCGAEGSGDKKGSKAKDAPPFIRNGNGHLAPIVANVLTELRSSSKWAVALDLFAGKEMLMEPLPDANGRKPNHFEPRPLEDGDIIRATEWFQRSGFQTMKKEAVADGLSVFAAENAFDPLVDHLRSLKWDGVGRLDTWLTYYCGAEPSPDQPAEYIAAAGLRWMISAVARALSPGCKVDTALVLVGKQGVGKSTVGKILAYRDEWFSDALPPVHSKEASDHIRGKWLIEFGEMATHSRSDAEEFKAFMTRREEKFRPPYGRKEIEYPRRCVFFGTTNRDAFLKDDTGNRRFWPVVVTKTDFAALEDEVDQLWAEAVWMFDQGERWHLDAAEAALAAGQQEAFMIVDERAEKLRNLITGRSQITALEALGLLGMEDDKREQMDVGSMLRSIGWRRSRTGRVRFWLPPVTTSVVTSESGGHADEGSEF